MIQANELRIGNWVFYGEPSPEGKHYIDVYTITKTGINGAIERDADMDAEGVEYTPGFYEWKFEELHPIPLTPEILEAAGFKEFWPGEEDMPRLYIKAGFDQLSDYGQQGIEFREGKPLFVAGYYKNEINCQYLHQLQNLYYSLTGEELQIKF